MEIEFKQCLSFARCSCHQKQSCIKHKRLQKTYPYRPALELCVQSGLVQNLQSRANATWK